MYNVKGLVLLLIVALVLGYLVLKPLNRRFDDSDQGSWNVVRLPPFKLPALARDSFFFAVAALVNLAVVAIRSPSPTQIYRGLVTGVLSSVVRDPLAIAAYTSRVLPLLPLTVLGFVFTFAIALPATPGRRVMILLHMPLFLALSVVTDCGIALVGITAGLPIGPAPIVAMFLQYTLAFWMILRMYFTTYQLPRVTQVPVLRRGDWRDNLVMILCLGASLGLVGGLAVWLIGLTGGNTLLDFFIVISIRPAVIDLMSVLLGLTKLAGHRVEPSQERPALEVIVPAYNEAVGIQRLLRSIDRAAAEYGGPVRVIMCDDGSTDGTYELATETIASFSYATGEVIPGEHAGKARALNLALSRCTSDYVYRVDADCALEPKAFIYSIAYFLDDPRVGLVGAFTIPKEPYTTWIDRMRAIEQVFAFGFLRPTLCQVDAVPCIPGTFCGFRREAGLAIGGFVDGMFGEDVDFTCALARLGWRAQIDPRIVSYEDVPRNVPELRIQRFRWGLGGLMSFGRFTPFGNGAPGPRFWFQIPKGNLGRLFVPAHFFFLVLSLEYCIFDAGAHHNFLRFLFALALTQLPAMVPRLLVMAYFRRLSLVPWLLLWVVFATLKRFFLLEAVLSCGVRPVRPPVAIRDRYPTWGALLGQAPSPRQSEATGA
ncbi:MAG TPA: glycosyltransferase family 2 protein [Streptosporangiaceae bacterium]|nr:glycosyltransferase family 2 protein [Streptosporangiaceae bacterium]